MPKHTPWAAALGKGAINASAWMPLSLLRGVGSAVGRMATWTPNRPHRVASENLQRCLPELGDARQQRQMVRRVLVHVATTALEVGAMWRWPADRLAALEAEPVGASLFEEARQTGRGPLILGPHVGNWEFLLQYLARRAPLIALYRPPRIAEFEEFVLRSRGRNGAVLERAGALGLRRLCRGLTQGRVAAIMPDQVPDCGGGIVAPFFGRPALTMTLVRGILRHFDVTPLMAYAVRQPDGRFSVHFEEPPPGLADDDPVRAATQLNLGIERCVRACPEQYLWTYKRFRAYHAAGESRAE